MFGKDKKEEFHEKVLYETQPNIFVYSKGILISMFVLGFLFFLYSAGIRYIGNMNVYLIESTKMPLTSYFALAIFVLIMIVILYIILKLLIWTSIKYTITESRVIVEKGILLQKKNYMPFNTIQDVSRSQSLLGKIFSVGTITLYSAYDGKEMELKDVSSPKKIEDMIFENMRGTHLRYRNIYDDDRNSDFHPIRPNSDEPTHYRRMEDLDDLELVDAKERKRQLRDIRRKAKNSRNGYNSSPYRDEYNPNHNNDSYYDDYYDDEYYEDDYYRDNRSNYGNKHYNNRGGYPDSHHHQYSGAIKESYERNPKKYFANNYEEFHQNNLDAQRDYQEQRSYSPNQRADSGYGNNYNPNGSSQGENKKSKGLSRFNPFSSDKEESYNDNISDEEFDSTINQAMYDMESNIKFEPSNSQMNHNKDFNQSSGRYNQSHNQNFNANYHPNRQYDNGPNRAYDDGYARRNDYDEGYGRQYDYDRSYQNRPYESNSNRQGSRRDDYDYYGPRDDYSDNYFRKPVRNDYGSRPNDYDGHNRSGNHKKSNRNSDRYQDYNYEDNSDYEKSNSNNDKKGGEKTPEDLFEKHSRKFRR